MTDRIPIAEITVDELSALTDGGTTVVVDVRMPDEYAEGHVPGALLIPLPEIADRLGEIPAVEHVSVICRSGGRSLKACEYLVGAGMPAANVSGGTLAWLEAGYPVVTGSEPG